MDYLVIENIPPYEGRWPFDLERAELTTREWGWVKRLSGYLPLTIEEGLADPELITVFACIALRRAGKVDVQGVPALFDRLSDAPFGSAITMETDAEEVEEPSPPPSSSNANGADSGRSSTPNSETSVLLPRVSGMPASASSVSAPQRSGS